MSDNKPLLDDFDSYDVHKTSDDDADEAERGGGRQRHARASHTLLNNDKTFEGMAQEETLDELAKLGNKEISKRILRLADSERRLLVVGTVALVVSSVFGMIMPSLVGKVIDSIGKDGSRDSLLSSVFMVIGVMTVSGLAGFVRNVTFTVAGERVVRRLRKMLFEAVFRQEIGFFDMTRTGELVNRLSSDAQVIQNTASVNVSMGLRFVGQLVAGIAFLFAISWQLTLVMLSVIPVLVFGASFYGRYVRKLSKLVQEALAKSSEVATEVLSAVRTVRSFSKDDDETQKYAVCIDESYRMAAKRAVARGTFASLATWFGGLAVSLVLWYGGSLVVDGRMTTGDLTSFLLYTLTITFTLGGLTELYGDFMKAIGSSERVFQLIDRVPKMVRNAGRLIDESAVTGRVELRDVSFSYPSRPDAQVLKNISMTLEPGKVIALVGSSGGGKSTIMNLILALYEPDSGTVLLDNQDVAELDQDQYRRLFGTVKQEPVLFGTTIAENIAYGADDASDAEIKEAARIANAHDFITEFHDGYRTLVGEKGARLSGGQRQRIAIARAVLRNPRVYCFDEATSSLDSNSEALVKESIDKLIADSSRAVLVIAHRLSTVVDADEVIVIDHGEIVERGTHTDLIERDGLYKTLVIKQLARD